MKKDKHEIIYEIFMVLVMTMMLVAIVLIIAVLSFFVQHIFYGFGGIIMALYVSLVCYMLYY